MDISKTRIYCGKRSSWRRQTDFIFKALSKLEAQYKTVTTYILHLGCNQQHSNFRKIKGYKQYFPSKQRPLPLLQFVVTLLVNTKKVTCNLQSSSCQTLNQLQRSIHLTFIVHPWDRYSHPHFMIKALRHRKTQWQNLLLT